MAPRGRIYRAWTKLVVTPLGFWLSRNVGWRLDPHLLRLSGGRLNTGMILPIALLETRGARTGQPRANGVIYFHDGERVTIVASRAGGPKDPAWFHNARAHPDVELNGLPFRALVVEDEPTRARLWGLADRVFPPFSSYRETASKAGREIPILQLVPAKSDRAASD